MCHRPTDSTCQLPACGISDPDATARSATVTRVMNRRWHLREVHVPDHALVEDSFTAVTFVCIQTHLLCSEGGVGAPPRAVPIAVVIFAERRSHGSPLRRRPAAMGVDLGSRMAAFV